MPGARISADLLHSRHKAWCERNDLVPETIYAMGRHVSNRGIQRVKSSGYMFYKGIECRR